MKKAYAWILLTVMILQPAAYASETTVNLKPLDSKEMSGWENYTWQDKLKRGGINFVTWPAEFKYSIRRVKNESGSGGRAWSVGLLEGAGRGMKRWFYSAVELLTFPFGFPDDEKEPLMQPAFVWDREKELTSSLKTAPAQSLSVEETAKNEAKTKAV